MKLFFKYIVFITIAISIGVQNTNAIVNDGSRYVDTSILNTPGKWVKLKVEENAIYKLTYKDIQNMGVDPSKAKIYGYGGWIIDEDFTKPYIDDLPEVPCWRSEGANGFLLFYGKGPVKWSYNNSRYIHENNPYSTYGVYFLTDATPGEPKKMEPKEFIDPTSSVLNYFEDYMLHEQDNFSIAKTGRELFGENFSGRNTQFFSFNIPGVLNGKGSVALSFVSTSTNSANLTLSINSASDANQYTSYFSQSIMNSGTYTTGFLLDTAINWGENADKNENTSIRIDFPCGISPAYLNYIRLNMLRKLQYYNTGYTFFRNSENLTKNVKYEIQNATNDLLVFDITGYYDVQSRKYNDSILIKTNFDNNTKTLSFYSETGVLREYALVDPNQNFPTPQKLSDVDPQNLHGLDQVEMVIISPKAFASEAERLAQEHSDLKVIVVDPEQIYNEFSSGTPDASAYRRFMKMFFDRAVTNNSLKPKYLLLFGDGMWDNRFLDPTCKGFNKNNFLLTYQVKESLKTDNSYSCDDYFGFLDETGDDKYGYAQRILQLGIGRFPIQSQTEAKSSVDKTIAYMRNQNPGIWKNSIVILADDSDTKNINDFTHMRQADQIADSVTSEYMVTKVYMDAYTPEMSSGKKSYDNSAKVALNKALKDGCILLNYTGHGGPSGLADNIISMSDVQTMSFKNLPLWITATCEFSWFDGTNASAGEQAFLNEKSGAIALFSASRLVYAQQNSELNKKMMNQLFPKNDGKTDIVWPTLGDVIRDSKNALVGDNNKLNYLLIGDPALRLNYPELRIAVDNIKTNGEEITTDTVKLKALDNVIVSGYIYDKNAIKKDFSGTLTANIFDGRQVVQTIMATNPDENGNVFHANFLDYRNKISQSYCNVKDGSFELSFTVLTDIADIKNLGKMNFYAFSNTGNSLAEANGSFMKYYIQGVNEDADYHSPISPEIRKIYLNNESFKSGDKVNETPFFFAEITDSLGINTSGSGMDHDIQIIIDNSTAMTYPLNDYYQPSQTEENTGTVGFSIPTLPEGEHTLKFQVWNILNNVAIETINFTVENGLKPELYDLTVRSNPAKIGTETKFVFNHNRPETNLEVKITVFDMSGRPVWIHNESDYSNLMEPVEIQWDLKTNNGSDIQPGIYLYSATVKSEKGSETTKAKKMIVVRQ
ncbi:MAG: type IX secretion system sortase PorU [Candidatus Azobacteroides sp.]|nr:type IX secretion system sortase PorU [Candidatus Azobacteroides sp.]